MDTKRCPKCGETKSHSEFHRHASRKDGLTVWCKLCARANAKRYLDANRDAVYAKNKIRRDANPWQYRKAIVAWTERNAAKVREYQRSWYVERAALIAERNRGRYAEKRDEILARCKEYGQRNRDIVYASCARRRASKKGATGLCSSVDRVARRAMWGGLCWICGGKAVALDHVKPLVRGGSNWPANLRPICQSCNSSKNDSWPGVSGLLQLKMNIFAARTANA